MVLALNRKRIKRNAPTTSSTPKAIPDTAIGDVALVGKVAGKDVGVSVGNSRVLVGVNIGRGEG